MDPLDSLIAQLAQAGSGGSIDPQSIVSLLKGAEDTMQKNVTRLPSVLESLDPSQISELSLFYLFALDMLSSTSGRDSISSFLTLAIRFFPLCSEEQIRLAPDKFASVSQRMKEQLVQRKEYARGILPLQAAIRKIQPSREHLTPQHAELMQCCLLARCYSAAQAILDDDILEVDAKRTALHPRDFLLYCYYGGMVHIGLKQYPRALELLLHAVTAPSIVLNAITVAAYKKFVLVSLIVNGQVPPFPKYTSSIVQRNLRSCCQSYAELSNAYNVHKADELQRCLTAHSATFLADQNLGLAKQAVASVHRRNIQRLTQTHLTLSLHDIAAAARLPSARHAELHVLRMIEDGDIFARISQKDGMLSFQEDPERYNSCVMAKRIDASIQRTLRLAMKVAQIDEQISCDRTYLNKVSMKERHGRYGDPEEADWGPQ